jgi:hypothetical protein
VFGCSLKPSLLSQTWDGQHQLANHLGMD